MKTKHTVLRFLVLVSIVLLQVFASCQNLFEPPNSELNLRASMGTGFFTFNLDEVTLGRTILPTTPTNVSDFNGFKLEFFSGGTVKKTVECPPASYSDTITLDVGSYELLVTAYLDAGRTKPAAQGSKTVEIKNGELTSAGVELAAITNAGQGKFTWTISYPTTTTSASMTISPIAGGTGTTRTLTSGATGSLDLNSGYYRVVFTLLNSAGTGAERWEILHVYQNMESAFACTFLAEQFQSYNTVRVTTGTGTGTGSLSWAIGAVLSGGTIVVDSGVGTITLTTPLYIVATKNFVLEGNGVSITKTWTATNYAPLSFNSGAVVTIRRVQFSNTQGRVIDNNGNLSLESCIFSNNTTTETNGSIIISWTDGTLNVKGSTFYKNSGNGSGAINIQGGSATLTGNLFYGNTNSSNTRPILYRYDGTATSGGYNVVDVPLGTGSSQSGWAAVGTDKVISGLPIAPDSFKLLSERGAQNVITTRPGGYPTADFYGNSILASNAAAGAVQATASGYLVEVSVNDSTLGSAAITSAPSLTADGLYTEGGSVTLTATPKPGLTGYEFKYWLVNDNQHYTDNPLTLTLTDHYKAQAVFASTSSSASVVKVLFTEPGSKTVDLNISGTKDIYLVKVNTSGFVVSAGDTGGPLGSSPIIASGNVLPTPDEPLLPRMGHPAADEYHANPPPYESKKPQSPDGPEGSTVFYPIPYPVGYVRNFWVESSYGNGNFVTISAKLTAQGTYGNIWVVNNLISDAQAQTLASKFDQIYPIETSLLGYENGGGPSGDGGWDGDKRIQILVYNIVSAGGFFWGKDIRDDTGSGQRSNEAEMFYVDAAMVNSNIDYSCSLLSHEFQHMIHYNQKFMLQGLNSATWYNEMLSMITEDVIAPLIGVSSSNSSHAIRQRIPTFLSSYYTLGVTEWGSGTPNQVSTSYAKGYAFGAYLLRNYGGARLLQEMLANNSTNIDSVTAALRTVNGNSGISFEEALRRYGEAMVFSGTMPTDVLSFDKTDTRIVNNISYTATKFNIWSDFGSTKPTVFVSTQQVEMRPYSLTVHQASNWTGRTGSVSITLQRPNDLNVEFYLMMK